MLQWNFHLQTQNTTMLQGECDSNKQREDARNEQRVNVLLVEASVRIEVFGSA